MAVACDGTRAGGTVDRQRAVRGLDPVIRVDGANDRAILDDDPRRMRDEGLHPESGLDELLEHFAEQNHRSFRGLLSFPHQPNGWEPELEGEIVTAPGGAAAVTISHVAPRGAAWGRQLVLVVFTEL